LGNGAGYALILVLVAVFRELLGSGKLFGIEILGHKAKTIAESTGLYSLGYENNGFMLLSPMALITVGIIIWIQRYKNRKLIEQH
jgi:Na+-transporting NADH:ubiquinone oxidoreductase subunit D